LVGAFHQRAAVSLFGRCIPSPRRHFLFGRCILRRALVFSFSRRISSPRRILFVRPVHPIVVPQSLRLPAHLPPIYRFGVVPFGRRIPRRATTDLVLFRLAGAFPSTFSADLVSSFAGAFAANPPIWCCSIWLAHPLAAPPLPI
jgi:hypothetical protein